VLRRFGRQEVDKVPPTASVFCLEPARWERRPFRPRPTSTDKNVVESAADARVAGRAGAALFAGAGALTLINSVATRSLGVAGVDVGLIRLLGVIALLSAVVTWFVPWSRLHPTARLVPAAWGLALLLASGHAARYAATAQATTAFPVFFVLIVAWLGLTQRRGMPAAFSCIISLGCVWLVATTPHVSVPLSGLLMSVATACLVGETIAFATERNRRHTRKLGALVRASSELRDVLSLAEGVDRVVEAMRTILGATEVTFAMSTPDANAGVDAMGEPGRSPRRRSRAVRPGRTRSDFDVPLVGPSGTLGIASVRGVKLDPFTDQLLQVMSFDLGGRLEQLRLLEVLGEQSFSDALTGVGNRRHADALTAQLSPGDAVLLIDLDHFKNVNDADGHRAGDRVLEELGAHLKSALREEDSVARYGGDEFLIRLNPKDGSPEQIAQRLLTSWLQAGAAVSFSVGIAVHVKEIDPLETFALADAALYEAKRSGRARICLAASSALPR